MKKALLILGLLMVSQTLVFAYYNENETASIDALKAQGFSESTLRGMDTAIYHNKGINENYVKYYQPKQSNSKIGKAYTALKLYVDPSQDDGKFFEHQINFTNTWTGDPTDYSFRTESRNKNYVENL